MVTKSFSATSRSVACSATVAPWPGEANVRESARTWRIGTAAPAPRPDRQASRATAALIGRAAPTGTARGSPP